MFQLIHICVMARQICFLELILLLVQPNVADSCKNLHIAKLAKKESIS